MNELSNQPDSLLKQGKDELKEEAVDRLHRSVGSASRKYRVAQNHQSKRRA